MGSWSVYCGISKISITACNDCVFLPLKPKPKLSTGYLPYLPAALPIFGKYSDYGSIEDIEEDANTKLIEQHFNCTIQEFVDHMTGYAEGDIEIPEEWSYMWIDRKVYDYMKSQALGYTSIDMGNREILEYIGFKYLGLNINEKLSDPNRYNHEFEFQGKKFYSDNTWLNSEEGEPIYYMSKLSEIVDIPKDKQWILNAQTHNFWEILDKDRLYRHLFWILGTERSYSRDSLYTEEFLKEAIEELKEAIEEFKASNDDSKESDIKKCQIVLEIYENDLTKKSKGTNSLVDKYVANYKEYGHLICDLVSIRHNMYMFSGCFEPFRHYLTPQCGEHDEHQKILEKFAEINKSYCYDEDEDY
jgi:hypothetical protein